MATADGNHWMGFNIRAMVKPQTPAEYKALLDEGIRLARQLNQQIEALVNVGEKSHAMQEHLRKMPATRLPLSFWTNGSRPGKPAQDAAGAG